MPIPSVVSMRGSGALQLGTTRQRPAPPPADPLLADRYMAGHVLRDGRGAVVQVLGRSHHGDYLGARCSKGGKIEEPREVLALEPARWPALRRLLDTRARTV